MEAAQSRLQDAHVSMRKVYQAKLRVLNVGDLVLWKTPGLGKSLSTSWEGPYCGSTNCEDNYKISWKQGSKTHEKIVHINKLKKPFVDSDVLPCHKVLTVLDQQANQEDDPFISD